MSTAFFRPHRQSQNSAISRWRKSPIPFGPVVPRDMIFFLQKKNEDKVNHRNANDISDFPAKKRNGIPTENESVLPMAALSNSPVFVKNLSGINFSQSVHSEGSRLMDQFNAITVVSAIKMTPLSTKPFAISKRIGLPKKKMKKEKKKSPVRWDTLRLQFTFR